MRVVDQVKFAHDGKRLFAAGTNVPDLRRKPDNRGITVWDFRRGDEPVAHLLPGLFIAGFSVNPSNGLLYVGIVYSDFDAEISSEYMVVDPVQATSALLDLAAGFAFVLTVHPSGRWLVAAGTGLRKLARTSRGRQMLLRWEHQTKGTLTRKWTTFTEGRRQTLFVACDPLENRIVTHEIKIGVPTTELRYELRIRNSVTGTLLETVPFPGRTIQQLLFSPDSRWLAVRAGPAVLVLNGRNLHEKPIKLHGAGRGNFTDIAYHSSGRFLAATSNDATVRLYDTETWELAKTFTWDIGRMRSIAFSPDGMLAAAGSDTGKVVVWDLLLLELRLVI
jgi:WD40 repeat protein